MKTRNIVLLLASLLALGLITGCDEAAAALLGGSEYVVGSWVTEEDIETTSQGILQSGALFEISKTSFAASYTLDGSPGEWSGVPSPDPTTSSTFAVTVSSSPAPSGNAPSAGTVLTYSYVLSNGNDTIILTAQNGVFTASRIEEIIMIEE